MKRIGNLFYQITDFNNLRNAYLKALKGKRFLPSAIIFDCKADENLHSIKTRLESNTYKIGNYYQFKIYDPKERLITAASFEDRIVHHAIMNVLEPVFEKQFIFHTYACRKEKGTHKAVLYAFNKVKSGGYFLKLDVRKYFDSINHTVLKEKLERIIKDRKCLNLLFNIIDSFGCEDKGLPIGNLTSQFFANLYLSHTDHFVIEKLKPQGYVRYMDDILLFSNSKAELNSFYQKLKLFVEENIRVEFKTPVINSCKNGVPFLGFLIKHSCIKVLSKNWKRKIRKIKHLQYLADTGKISCEEFYSRFQSIVCFLPLVKKKWMQVR